MCVTNKKEKWDVVFVVVDVAVYYCICNMHLITSVSILYLTKLYVYVAAFLYSMCFEEGVVGVGTDRVSR